MEVSPGPDPQGHLGPPAGPLDQGILGQAHESGLGDNTLVLELPFGSGSNLIFKMSGVMLCEMAGWPKHLDHFNDCTAASLTGAQHFISHRAVFFPLVPR